MACSSSRSYSEANQLSDRTRAVHQVTSQRSALPAAFTAEELLSILHEAAPFALSSSSPSASSSGYADAIRRRCPTGRRVQSSFAAAGAHSALGEMLQFFAVSLTHLFTDGVESAAALSFPSAWEQRLNSPDASLLREKYLYELQGFSTLFTYVWGCVAAAQASSHLPRGEEERADEMDGAGSACRTTAAPSPTSATSPASLAPLESKERWAVRVQRTAPPAAAAAAAAASPPPALLPLLPQLEAKAGHALADTARSTTSRAPATETTPSRRPQSLPLSSTEAAPGEVEGPARALSVQLKGRGHFLPPLPLEGLVPSGQLPKLGRAAGGEDTQRGGRSPPQASSSSARHASPLIPHDAESVHLSPSAKQLAIQQAMEQDRARQVRRTLGVRQVRNFAKEGDMHDYLQSFQQNMRSVLDDSASEGGEAEDGDKDLL